MLVRSFAQLPEFNEAFQCCKVPFPWARPSVAKFLDVLPIFDGESSKFLDNLSLLLIWAHHRNNIQMLFQLFLFQVADILSLGRGTNLEWLEVRTCGLWSVEFEQSCGSYGAWLCKYLGSARVSGCTEAVWSLPLPLMCWLFTAIMREATDELTSPRATSILPAPTMGNNANLGRNSWKDKPLGRSFSLPSATCYEAVVATVF
ncbi:hypothetical protein AVEN_233048-1 [Araneus ventricosus]|uniref:Uncharacterized protein n=1 Tax=Araneus ventricosus TaxID=182803 RepID=A0A4Y2HE39_ARAVE|nr:hypothetical protein AVEN_233048-1 [Araneus ventricosus]